MTLSIFTDMIINSLSPTPEHFEFEGTNYDYAMKNSNEVIQMSMMFLEAIGYLVYYDESSDIFLIQSPVVH